MNAPAPVVDLRSLVDGSWRAATERIGTLHDPNTGAERQAQVASTPVDVEAALAAADALAARGDLERIPTAARIEVLSAFATALDAETERIAVLDAVSTGNPVTTTRRLAGGLGGRVRAAADELRAIGDWRDLDAGGRTVRLGARPLGPALVLAPWNAPTFVAVSKVAAAFAAGCPVILKPSEWTPSGAQVAMELLEAEVRAAGFPRAAVQLVHGAAEVGAALSGDGRVRVLTFTGGGAAGRSVARQAAEHCTVTQLELGSNNPVVVLDDAELDRTAASIVAGMTRLNGQWCEAPGKILAPARVVPALVDAMLGAIDETVIGHCLDERTTLGPLAFGEHRDRLLAQVDAYRIGGATVLRGGAPPELGGWFVQPRIVLDVPHADAVSELFGPVVTVHATSSVEDAIVAANGPATGLDAFVFGRDEERALAVGERIRAGEVRINGTWMSDLAPGSEQSFWGNSGVGGHGPGAGVTFFQGRRVVGVDATRQPI